MKSRRKTRKLVMCGTALTLAALAVSAAEQAAPAHTKGYNELRNPYFGQTHQHTGWSFDEAIYNVRLGPDTSYRHARGEKVKHPAGYDVQLKVPLDFLAVSDHSEYLGVLLRMYDPNDPLSKHPLALEVTSSGNDVAKATKVFYKLVSETIQPDGSIKADPVLADPALKRTIWDQYIQIADSYNEPGKFTTLIGYEWSSQPNMSNLHRNVIFRSSKNLPVPFSYFDSQRPEDLWKWMDAQRAKGTQLLAIPHNGNLSNGAMFALTDSDGKPISRAYAETRARNERLPKSCRPRASRRPTPPWHRTTNSPDFELWTKPVAGPGTVKVLTTNYVRNAFENGLALEKSIGVNPFKYGVVGGGDIHTAIVSHEEFAFTGEHNLKSSTPHARLLEGVPGEPSKIEQGSAGCHACGLKKTPASRFMTPWRARRRGPPAARASSCGCSAVTTSATARPGDKEWVRVGYRNGVPMGGDLKHDAKKLAPRLMIAARRTPNSGNLDRIQVIKGWVDAAGKTHDKIYDVAWSGNRKIGPDGKLPAVGNSVDIKNASYTNTIGSPELATIWKDPDFDPAVPAFYYVRVLEIPTPRWSTYDAKALGIDPPKDFPATIQERAWTSPIWYSPSGG